MAAKTCTWVVILLMREAWMLLTGLLSGMATPGLPLALVLTVLCVIWHWMGMAPWFNTVPVAVADSYSTPEEQVLVVAAPGVIENDYDDNGDTFQASVIV